MDIILYDILYNGHIYLLTPCQENMPNKEKLTDWLALPAIVAQCGPD